jgi:hypothetical protein
VNIEAVLHIEQMSQTWYRDFRNCVKKHFRKEYNPILREADKEYQSGTTGQAGSKAWEQLMALSEKNAVRRKAGYLRGSDIS